jgi:hypothetical protein
MQAVRGVRPAQRSQSRRAWWVALATILLVIFGWPEAVAAQSGAIIFVTTLEDKISSRGGCSLQEAIYSANFDNNIAIDRINSDGSDHFITTQCVAGSGDDTIVLPSGGVFLMNKTVDDAHNPFGPTATPLITSNITIEAFGATLQYRGSAKLRAFAIGSTGHLTIQDAYIKGFLAIGGDGGNGGIGNFGGGGGGMGAGGAIYVHAGGLVVENTTFEGNGAIGGNGGKGTDFGGGGGGLGGNGVPDGFFTTCEGGAGGGGSRGNGAIFCGGHGISAFGGGGGGTVFNGVGTSGGFDCGGNGGDGGNGQAAPCPGGGGGGGGNELFVHSGDGGKGNYGGGGGGGANKGGNGGNGGFGGGGGAGWSGVFGGTSGGNGGFGGGGGVGPDGSIGGGNPGNGGMFGGNANSINGGGGAGLGGAIFNDSGSVVVRNSTFFNNFVARGVGGGAGASGAADNGADAGGAIFTVNGHLTVNDVTIAGNQSTGSGGGIVVVQTSDNPLPTSLSLDNTIIFNNGAMDLNGNLTNAANECTISGAFFTNDGAGNLIQNNDNCQGVVSTDDPHLGLLQPNGGDTPTMAISSTSPAFNAADPSTSLLTAQNGVSRPLLGGFDIGAFELCTFRPEEVCPGRIAPPPDTEPLIIQVSPTPSGGTTIPFPGNHTEPFNSVIGLSATPSNGYSFVNWSPNVAVPSNPSTTVTMDQPQTVIAYFTALPTSILGNISAKSGPSNNRDWTLSLLNNGPGGVYGATIPSFTLTQTFGAACTPVVNSALPLPVADIPPGQTGTANVFLNFTGCALTARFTATFTFSANNGAVTGSVVRANQFQ